MSENPNTVETTENEDLFKYTSIKNINIGSKYFRFNEETNEFEILRVYSIVEEKGLVKYFTSTGERKTIDWKKLLEEYKLLRPDAVFSALIVNVSGEKDVIVALVSTEGEIRVICRQNIFDFFANNTKKIAGMFYVGVSVSRETCPANINFEDIMGCDGINFQRLIYVYLDDTLDDILKLFNHNKFNAVLRNLSMTRRVINGEIAQGYCKTLRELLESNNFMYDFRKNFGIIELPFPIDEDKDMLSSENTLFLENEFKKNIMETYVIRYSREIDLHSIKREYVLAASATDKYNKIYIIGYDTYDNPYVPRTSIN